MNDLFIQGLTIDWNRVRPYNYCLLYTSTVTMASAISKIPKRKMSCLPLLKMWNSFFIVSGIVIL